MPSESHKFTNHQLAEIFLVIADLLEIKGEVIYKILAYRKAAESLANLSLEAVTFWREGRLHEIPGVGKAIAEKIDELFTTGKLAYQEKLMQEVPLSLVELLQVPDLGPKKVALFWKQAAVTNLEELEAAARSGRLRNLPGMGEKSEAKILAGIESLARREKRIPLGNAWQFAQELINYLRSQPGVQQVEIAGSLRRMRATVGDLDLLAAAPDSHQVMQAFTGHPGVLSVKGQGETKASVEFSNGLRAQLWVHSPARFGTALQYATGSKDHNVRLRELALKKGLSLSDQALTRSDGSEITCASEEEVYHLLDLPYIPPELREDRGEIQAAKAGQLPNLIQNGQSGAELHAHSNWSDGKFSIREMALAARERGKRILAITDHSASLGVANGLTIERLHRQREELETVQAELGDSLLLLHGSEIEIRADGNLDYPDNVLASLDIVIASLHTSLRQPRQQVTERLLNAIRNPHVDVIGHPTGRMLPNREGADLDMETVMNEAARCGVALEINAHPARLDLDDIYARRAAEMGIPLCINTDAHSPADFDFLFFGVAVARRGWIEPHQVINTWDNHQLLKWLKNRGV